MKLTITIQMDNAAFEVQPDMQAEAARILRELAGEIIDGEPLKPGLEMPLLDVNGNLVGKAKVSR